MRQLVNVDPDVMAAGLHVENTKTIKFGSTGLVARTQV
jgi:hypothetical protein